MTLDIREKKLTCPNSSFKSDELQIGISPVIGQRNSSSQAKNKLPINFCISVTEVIFKKLSYLQN